MDPFQESAEHRRELAGLMIRRLIGHGLGLQLRWQHTTEPVFVETASPKEITAMAEPKCPAISATHPIVVRLTRCLPAQSPWPKDPDTLNVACAEEVTGLRAALPRGQRASG